MENHLKLNKTTSKWIIVIKAHSFHVSQSRSTPTNPRLPCVMFKLFLFSFMYHIVLGCRYIFSLSSRLRMGTYYYVFFVLLFNMLCCNLGVRKTPNETIFQLFNTHFICVMFRIFPYSYISINNIAYTITMMHDNTLYCLIFYDWLGTMLSHLIH